MTHSNMYRPIRGVYSFQHFSTIQYQISTISTHTHTDRARVICEWTCNVRMVDTCGERRRQETGAAVRVNRGSRVNGSRCLVGQSEYETRTQLISTAPQHQQPKCDSKASVRNRTIKPKTYASLCRAVKQTLADKWYVWGQNWTKYGSARGGERKETKSEITQTSWTFGTFKFSHSPNEIIHLV